MKEPPPGETQPTEVKLCRFLNPHPILVTADLDGMLNFWGVTPSAEKDMPPLCIVRNENETDVGKLDDFPIRALDFD